jgi:putative ATPase
VALGTLELALGLGGKVTKNKIEQAAGKKLPGYDKKGDGHYDNISAFIKSMRASDEQAALFYMARMVAAGEDPKFIARRMVVFASEDIGLAGNGALGLALNAFMAVERIGMPESGIILSHVVVALCRGKKSRESYDLWGEAQNLASHFPDSPVPIHVRNAPTKLMKDLGFGEGQKWVAGFKHTKPYLPDEVVRFLNK